MARSRIPGDSGRVGDGATGAAPAGEAIGFELAVLPAHDHSEEEVLADAGRPLFGRARARAPREAPDWLTGARDRWQRRWRAIAPRSRRNIKLAAIALVVVVAGTTVTLT